MFERIVAFVDGSEAAELALPYSGHLARHLGTPLHLVRVVDAAAVPRATRYGDAETSPVDLETEVAMAEEYLDVVSRHLEAIGATVTGEVRHGNAAPELINACRQRDLLVVASHEPGSHPCVPVNDIAEEVARLAPVPVMIVR